MQIQTHAQILIQAQIEQVFDASIDCQNLPQFFTGYQAIPGIESATTADGLPLREGGTRIVQNRDRSTVEETILALKRPMLQEYVLVKGLKPPFSWLVDRASGKWVYQTVETGTQVDWTFTFDSLNIIAAWLIQLLVKKPFQKAQEICLGNLKHYCEKS